MIKNTLYMARLASLLALILTIQMIGLPQAITGPLVNAFLYLTTGILGLFAGVLLGLLTPWVALIRGQLMPAAAPVVPFIMMSNVTLVMLFWMFRIRFIGKWDQFLNPWTGIIFSASGKFFVLFTAVKLLIPLYTGSHLPAAVEAIFTFPQLLTALAGGMIYFFLFRIWEKIK